MTFGAQEDCPKGRSARSATVRCRRRLRHGSGNCVTERCAETALVCPAHSGPIRRPCQGAEDIELRWGLAPPGGVPGSYGFDAIVRVKMLDGRPERRFLMWRVRRYDPKLLSESLAELGWKTIERIDLGPDGKKTLCLMLL